MQVSTFVKVVEMSLGSYGTGLIKVKSSLCLEIIPRTSFGKVPLLSSGFD
jgi:hypothetical protein